MSLHWPKRCLRLILLPSLSLIAAACQSVPDSPLYAPSSSKMSFDYAGDEPFEAYVRQASELINTERVFLAENEQDKATEFERVKPFEQALPATCPVPVPHGVLLLHGVLDTPFAMRDIAAALAERCIASRAILLPGHGTRPGDMLGIHWRDWVAAAQYGVRSLKREHESVSMIGFSLGGLISLHTAAMRSDVHRIVALSPALHVGYPYLVWHAQWLRHFVDWMDRDPFRLSVRYSATSTNGVAQIYALSKEVQSLIKSNGLATPALVIQSQDEITIDPIENRNFMQEYMPSPHHLIEYGANTIGLQNSELRKSFYPEEHVLNFSHVTLPYRPDNPVFGRKGSHKECGENIGLVDAREAEQCIANAVNWKGEVGSAKEDKYRPVQRLTFNPDFDAMIESIVNWITVPVAKQ